MKSSPTVMPDPAGSDSASNRGVAGQEPTGSAAAAPSTIDATIEVWFAKHFHNLGALLDERMHNVIQAAKEDLKAELAKL
ncbi:MAG TPA: hypothetical protein VIO35_07855 [Chloroflexota bacterium]|jgi:hypothetical protein